MNRLDPKTTALVVVDIQERLAPAMDKESFARLVKNVDLLVYAASLLHVSTVATEQYPKGLGPTLESLRAPLSDAGAEMFAKTTFSAMDSPEVARWLARLAPRSVVVVGVEAHVCIFQTVRDLAAAGFDVLVPYDAVASRRPEDCSAALTLASKAGATVTTTETIVFDWLQKAEGDAFKALSKRMR